MCPSPDSRASFLATVASCATRIFTEHIDECFWIRREWPRQHGCCPNCHCRDCTEVAPWNDCSPDIERHLRLQVLTIFDVNKQTKNAVFTPELEYDSYVIRGCMFGKQPGQILISELPSGYRFTQQPQFLSRSATKSMHESIPKRAGSKTSRTLR